MVLRHSRQDCPKASSAGMVTERFGYAHEDIRSCRFKVGRRRSQLHPFNTRKNIICARGELDKLLLDYKTPQTLIFAEISLKTG